ncbi:MAG: NTP transferase domain-containing protein, partial [Spirochaetia bacterium]|nr:NTP transferase domain-containing protein [Spirochaetia bacterium]
MKQVTAIIMAAGRGTRMKSKTTKVLHPVGGKPMLAGVIDSCMAAGINDIVVIVGANRGEVEPFLKNQYQGGNIRTVLQAKQLGTAHAIKSALALKHKFGPVVMLLSGDVPLISPDTIRGLINEFTKEKCGGIICTSKVGNPHGYGRIVTDKKGYIIRIVEENNATDEERAIRLINGGVYVIRTDYLKKYIRQVKPDPVKKEYYLTDLAAIMAEKFIKIRPKIVEYSEVAGINDRVQLQEANVMKNKKT